MNEEQIIDKVSMIDQWKVSGDSYTQGELDAIGQLLELYYDNKKQLEQEKEKNKELEAKRIWNKLRIEGLKKELVQEKEKNKELEEHQRQYLDGELITAKQGKFFEKMIKENYIRKDKLKAIQGELCMQLRSYVRNEASPEQERIAGGINIINKILEV